MSTGLPQVRGETVMGRRKRARNLQEAQDRPHEGEQRRRNRCRGAWTPGFVTVADV